MLLAASAPRAEELATSPALRLPETAPECVRWAAGEVERTLQSRGRPDLPPGAILIDLTAPGALPPEGYELEIEPDGPVRLRGGDATGAMYGLLELASQFRGAPPERDWTPLRRRLEPRREAPYLPVRALNIFLHADTQRRLAPWFYEQAFWTRLFDLLAESRFNVLDIHGPYVPETTGLGDLWTIFGGTGEAAARDRAQLARIAAWAEARGVRLALMSYGKGDEEKTDALGEALARVCRQTPNLAFLGARLKRTGSDAREVFENGYVKPARRAGYGGDFITRSWGTDLETIQKMADLARGRLSVELKFNGEHLGLPYPAVHGRGEDYGFQDYLLPGRNFEVLWQVRAAGTHRVFRWCDPDFARVAARSFALGGARGFSIEPLWAYHPVELVERYREPARVLGRNERYVFEANRAWYLAWGRLSYNPATPDAVFERDFAARYGPEAGPLAYAALRAMSRVVPRVYSTYCAGLDHRDYAPELEIAALPRDRKAAPRKLHDLAAIGPLDGARACSPAEFAAAVAQGKPEGRENPWQAADALEFDAACAAEAADRLVQALGRAEDPAPLAGLAAEARALAALGRSHAQRLRALTAWALFERNVDPRWARVSGERMAEAVRQWKDLADVADKLFLPVQDPLRAGRDFAWSAALKPLETLEAEARRRAEAARARYPAGADWEGEPRGHARVRQGRASFARPELSLRRQGKQLAVTLAFPAGDPRPDVVAVLFKGLRSEPEWRRAPLKLSGAGLFAIELQEPPGGLLLQFVLGDAEGGGAFWPDAAREPPYLWTRAEH
ncbi:MAG: glycoside hydrolase family 20 zincin-like fold domain-containing protein [Planctomycetota bacterium]|nr:glycoside hydrolase family 20 zincin-like fold domain-containing protein [Planctomycetota bacterium]